MSKLNIDHLREVIDYLDEEMTQRPNRQLADTSNYLEELHKRLESEQA